MKLSEHFTLEEFIKSPTATAKKIDNTPTSSIIYALYYGVSKILEPARIKLGEKIVITSGYRSKALNTAIGGVYNSQHMKGEAADIRLPSKEYADRLFNILKGNKNVDQLLYEHSKQTTWIHVSWSTKPRQMFRYNYQA